MQGDGVGCVEGAGFEFGGCCSDDVEDEGDVRGVEQLDLEEAGAEHLVGRGRSETGIYG